MSVRDEREARALFDRRYGTAQVQVQYEIERRVIGGDWGANGYTTMAQADALASGLGLSASDLDVMLAFRATAAAWLA